MTTEKIIDEAIFESLEGKRRKVALIQARAAHIISEDTPDYDKVYNRIIQLVGSGVLRSFGNLEKPRFSEVEKV